MKTKFIAMESAATMAELLEYVRQATQMLRDASRRLNDAAGSKAA